MNIEKPDPTATDFDYGIYFRLLEKMDREKLVGLARSVKDKYAPWGHREFSVAIDESAFCYIQVQDTGTSQQSVLKGNLFELTPEDTQSLDQVIKEAEPTHLLAFRVNTDEDPKDRDSEGFQKMLRYCTDFYHDLYDTKNERVIGPPILHNKAAGWVMPV